MRTHYASFEALIERIDDVSHVILDYVNPQTVSSSTISANDPEIIQLQSAVECTIMKHLFSTITAEVMRALREGFGSTDWIRNSSIWQETVLRCMVDNIQYDCVRDDIHKSVLSMVFFGENWVKRSSKRGENSEICSEFRNRTPHRKFIACSLSSKK